LQELWRVKDHCADLMTSYIAYPYLRSNLITLSNFTDIHSNTITGGFTTSFGEGHLNVSFSKVELLANKEKLFADNLKHTPFKDSSAKPTLLEKGMQRIAIAYILTQTARSQNDLGIKISHYCTVFESLFSSDNIELTHKLSERIACFLEDNFDARKKIFKQVKEIYSIRSKVVHGSTINVSADKLKNISKQTDDLVRRVTNKIQDSADLDKFFRKMNSTEADNKEFEEYMLDLVLGKPNCA